MSVLALPRRRLSTRRALGRAHALAGSAWVALTVLLLALLVGRLAFVGGDARWLAALGRTVLDRGIPRGVPFAAASTVHWHNPLVLAELCLYALEHAFGDPGLVAAQTLALAAGLGLLARDMRAAGAAAGAVVVALTLVVVGGIVSLAVVRVQLFSLVLFPALLLALRSDARNPSPRIWASLPLLALWSNLHGAVLAGLVVLYPYLLLSRLRLPGRRLQTLAVAALAPLALCATPAGLGTISYYHGVLTNVAAQRGAGMWAPLGTGAFDLALIVVAVAMVALQASARRWPRAWELLATAVLAAATVRASRDGIWLLFVLASPAAAALAGRHRASHRPGGRDWLGLLPLAAAAVIALLVLDVGAWIAGSRTQPPAAVARAVALAHGSPILADTVPGEQVALAGGRIWVGNPIDAFSHAVQARFLDFDQGLASGSAALELPQIRVVVVSAGSPAAALVAADHGYRRILSEGGYSLYVRR